MTRRNTPRTASCFAVAASLLLLASCQPKSGISEPAKSTTRFVVQPEPILIDDSGMAVFDG